MRIDTTFPIHKLFAIVLLYFPLSCGGLAEMHNDLYNAAPVCMSTDGSDLNDGRGWNTAVKTFSRAAALAGADGEIWVTGNYTLSGTAFGTASAPVSVYGGFKGSESRREERDLSNKTILSGNGNSATGKIIIASPNVTFDGFQFSEASAAGSGIYINGSNYSASVQNCDFTNNPVSTAVFHSISASSGSSVKISGCTFTRNGTSTAGAAIYISASVLDVQDSIFSDNASISSSNYGSAVRIDSNSVAVFSNCVFERNTAYDRAGAIYADGSGSIVTVRNSTFSANTGAVHFNGTSLDISGCDFNRNTCTDVGSAVCFSSSGTFSLTNSVFTRNTSSENGGALYVGTSSGITISGCSFGLASDSASGNTSSVATKSGGAIYFLNSCHNYISISNTSFYYNKALTTAVNEGGGAVYYLTGTGSASITFSSCTFGYNSIPGASGGAINIYNTLSPLVSISSSSFIANTGLSTGGAVRSQSPAIIKNSIFYGNTANSYGGAVWISSGSSIINSDFIQNSAVSGGAAYFDSTGILDIYNSIDYGNSASAGGSFIYQMSSGSVNIYSSLRNGSVFGNVVCDSSCITGNPYFINPAGLNFSIKSNSPCINAGNSSADAGSYDYTGRPRRFGIIDIGAYEYQ